jgi:hypothetical protein
MRAKRSLRASLLDKSKSHLPDRDHIRVKHSLLAGVLLSSIVIGSAIEAVPALASPAASPAIVEVHLSAGDQNQLRDLYAGYRHIPRSDIGRAIPGAMHAARVTGTGREWAVMKFTAARRAPLTVSVGFQDGGAIALFTRSSNGPWKVTGLGGPQLSCDNRLPVTVRRLWGYTTCAASPAAAPAIRRASRTSGAVAQASGTTADVAKIARSLVGVQDNPAETTFSQSADCNPFTGIEVSWASTAGCGTDTTDFNTTVQDRTEFWCSDFAKYVWSQAGVTSNLGILTPAASSFLTWGDQSGQTLTLDGANPRVGDAIVLFPSETFSNSSALQGYSPTNLPPAADHVGIVVGVNSGGDIEVVNGDFEITKVNIGVTNIGVTVTGSYTSPAAFAASAENDSGEQWVFVSPGLPGGVAVDNSPAAGIDSGFNVYTFWKGTNGGLYENNRTGSGSWSGAHEIPAMGPLGSQPTVAVTSAGNQYVFWEGTNGYLWEGYYLNGSWNGPNEVTDTAGDKVGPMASPPTAGVDSSGNVYVFWKNSADGGLEETSGKGYQPGSFSGYHEIAGTAPLGSAPAVAVSGGGNQYVFWQSATGNLEEAYNLNGTWNGPNPVTDTANDKMGPMATAPGAGIDSSGNVYVFWKNSADGGLQETSGLGYQPGSFNPQHEISGMAPLGSAPGAAVAGDGNQLVFWKGANASANLFEANWNGTWNGPTNLGSGPLG